MLGMDGNSSQGAETYRSSVEQSVSLTKAEEDDNRQEQEYEVCTDVVGGLLSERLCYRARLPTPSLQEAGLQLTPGIWEVAPG